MALTSIKFEGSLVLPDLENITDLPGQTAKDFNLPKNTNMTDEIASCWAEIKNYWSSFQRALQKNPESKHTGITRDMFVIPILRELGYEPLYTAKSITTGTGKSFPISHRADQNEDSPPIHIISVKHKIGEKVERVKYNAHQLIQTFLNEHEHIWAMVTNGLQWRLIRDCSLMSKSSYVEIDLEQIITGENFAEFIIFYRLLHRTRLPKTFEDSGDCILEHYHQMAIEQGGRVREKLRVGVEKAIEVFGQGILDHPKNTEIKNKIINKDINSVDYYREILLFIYRMLFLMVAESRNLIFDSKEADKKHIYVNYYSIERLRKIADKKSLQKNNFTDLWTSLKTMLSLFDESSLGQHLNLSPLNGRLFSQESLQFFSGCELYNYDLIEIIKALSVYIEDSNLQKRVNYSAIDVEELGSVYESLLDLHPAFDTTKSPVKFSLIFGMERKSTGSYYTRADLVGELIKSTLEPVINERLKEKDPERALLDIKVIDPACGSGHFLLAAARKIAEALAQYRKGEDQPDFDDIRHAKRDVITHCIYGVDLNPLAVDLCRVALWIEGFERGKPLTFLDHRIKCGNSLVGVFKNSILKDGIPDEAFTAVTGDHKPLATEIKRKNKLEREERISQLQLSLFSTQSGSSKLTPQKGAVDFSSMKEDTPEQVKLKEKAYNDYKQQEAWVKICQCCDLWIYVFFAPIIPEEKHNIPTSIDIFNVIDSSINLTDKLLKASAYAVTEKFFHWECEFPEVFAKDGFDVVVGNPPWDVQRVQEVEFFSSRDLEIAKMAGNKRKEAIQNLKKTNCELYNEFIETSYRQLKHNQYIVNSGLFVLTNKGKSNYYRWFAELFLNLLSPNGVSSIIVPTGIATDNSSKDFFGSLVDKDRLIQLLDFENRKTFFPDVHASFKFSILTIGYNPKKLIKAGFFLTNTNQIDDERRVFKTTSENYKLFNPNTKTSPVFRTSYDAKLAEKIYKRVPVLINETTNDNIWNIMFYSNFLNMTTDSHLFKNEPSENSLRLYEAKLMHQYDHRWATYDGDGKTRDLTDEEKQNPYFIVTPQYWVEKEEVSRRLKGKWDKEWLIGFRDIARATDERTSIFSVLPKVGVGNKIPLVLFKDLDNINLITCFLADTSTFVFDYSSRQKLGGTSMNLFYVRQFPILPPEIYTKEDIYYIKPRVLELAYTAYDLKTFAKDMGYDGEPFKWDVERRAQLKAELDAYYAKLYDLTKEELLYILDPQEVFGEDYPGETFRVLKEKEIRHYGEYRTKKLVMEAFERL